MDIGDPSQHHPLGVFDKPPPASPTSPQALPNTWMCATEWGVFFRYDLEIFPIIQGKIVVIATDRPDDLTLTVAGEPEFFGTVLCLKFGIPLDKLVLIEHARIQHSASSPLEYRLVVFERMLPPPPPPDLVPPRWPKPQHHSPYKRFVGFQRYSLTPEFWKAIGLPPRT